MDGIRISYYYSTQYRITSGRTLLTKNLEYRIPPELMSEIFWPILLYGIPLDNLIAAYPKKFFGSLDPFTLIWSVLQIETYASSSLREVYTPEGK